MVGRETVAASPQLAHEGDARMSVKFDGEVALVTGASRGLGSAFARCLAEAGATVAVNSTGKDDGGKQLVAEIEAGGGRAIDLPGEVEKGDELVARVVGECGRIDAVVHNAGFIQDKSVAKMSPEQWDAVLAVHLRSAFLLSRAAWPHFAQRGRGRIVFLTSAAGLYGNFGQANYAAAKMGMYGLCRSIAIEGAKQDITCNCVAPFGVTDMNRRFLPEVLHDIVRPDLVAPLVGFLCHPDCTESGGLFEASAGTYKKVRWERSEGLSLDPKSAPSIDSVAEGWEKIVSFTNTDHPQNMGEALAGLYQSKVPRS